MSIRSLRRAQFDFSETFSNSELFLLFIKKFRLFLVIVNDVSFFSGDKVKVSSVSFLSQGERVACAGSDCTVSIVNLQASKEAESFSTDPSEEGANFCLFVFVDYVMNYRNILECSKVDFEDDFEQLYVL